MISQKPMLTKRARVDAVRKQLALARSEWLKGLTYQPQVVGILTFVDLKRWFILVDFHFSLSFR
jgi:hypothetical protein